MKVLLAGYNVDTEALKGRRGRRRALTPESIAAAYARISRSVKSVDALRQEARGEVEKARTTNRRIIFNMGHHSVAEHAVFNFDIIGISRRCVEELEKFRLCSYTEKSQRYVTLKGDYVVPGELKDTHLCQDFRTMVKRQNALYVRLYDTIRTYNAAASPKGAKTKSGQRTLENLAKEDARYILAVATQTQLGATINARNVELIIRRCASHRLQEMNELGRQLYRCVHKVAPSVILFCTANDYDQKTYPQLRSYCRTLIGKTDSRTYDVILIDYTRNADAKILAALLFRSTQRSYAACLRAVQRMSLKRRNDLFKKVCQYMELYDAAPREFECAQLTYSLTVSSACFGQLKRHRIATLVCQEYDPDLGYTVPESVQNVGEAQRFAEIIEQTKDVYSRIEKKHSGVGSYILTNAHRKRILLSVNLRELYHISRLREDSTAQWDIRDKAHKMTRLAKKVMPVTTQLLGGKEDYPRIYYKLFGKKPRITEVPEPN
jgi:flavin-dependent thymidylate synthase